MGDHMSKSNKTQYAVLGALSIEPMSGYEIKKMMAESTNYFWTESNGQLYPTLAQLAKAKLVTIHTEKVGAKPKNIYSITNAGKKKLQQWLLEDPEYYPGRDELLLKLFYGDNNPPTVSIDHIEKHYQRCKRMLSLYQGIEKKLTEMVKLKKHPVYYLITVKAGVKAARAEIAWSKEAIELIKKFG